MARKPASKTQSKTKPIAADKKGRPSIYSEEIAGLICERLAKGQTLRSICRDDDFPAESTVRQWAMDDYKLQGWKGL